MKPSALLLNATYEPISVLDWQDTMTLLTKDKVQPIEYHDDVTVSSANDEHKLPSVVRLLERAHVERKEVAFSRRNVYLRDNFTCQYCGEEFPYDELTYDHVVPQSEGGPTTWENIVTACSPCNMKKDDRTPEEAGMELRSEPKKPGKLPFGMRLYRRNKSEDWEPYLWT